MRKRTWQPARPKKPRSPRVPDDVQADLTDQADVVVADLKRRYSKRKKTVRFNRCDDIFVRWHREALYFVVVMRTEHGRPPTFETHAARMQHAGNGKFDLAVPMRRGWNTVMRAASADACLKMINESVSIWVC